MISEDIDPIIVRWNEGSSELIETLRRPLGPGALAPRRVPLDVLRRSHLAPRSNCLIWSSERGCRHWDKRTLGSKGLGLIEVTVDDLLAP
jgi:hypothetical protein